MTVLERKAHLVKTILDDSLDEDMLAKVEIFVYMHKRPCQYTVEEVRKGIRKSIEDVEANRITSYEDVAKRYSL
ncbi:MAG: hypothetical protein LBS08_02335 [Candidatus Symbiothrix sp.]|jgi:hypothetical protein|nr:hypothetical protein [Candidatus Symbiothrix sp.]